MSKSKTELAVSKPMTLVSSDSSFVQPAAWPFNSHAFCSSADNLHETEAANWTTSRLYNARTIHWKAAATITEPKNLITVHMQNRSILITEYNTWTSSHLHKKKALNSTFLFDGFNVRQNFSAALDIHGYMPFLTPLVTQIGSDKTWNWVALVTVHWVTLLQPLSYTAN